MRSVKITTGLNPYEDGSGHAQTVTVVRSEKDGKDAEFAITLEDVSARVDLTLTEWRAMSAAVERAIQQATN